MQETSYTPNMQTHLLSLSQCGCYLSTHDIVHLGHCIHLDLAYKKREELLRIILLHVHNAGHEELFKQSLYHLLEYKEKRLMQSIEHTRKTAGLFTQQLVALQETKLRFCTQPRLH